MRISTASSSLWISSSSIAILALALLQCSILSNGFVIVPRTSRFTKKSIVIPNSNNCWNDNQSNRNDNVGRLSSSSSSSRGVIIWNRMQKYGGLWASSNEYDDECDVLVLGSGPAARAIATLLSSSSSSSSSSLDVLMADKNFDRKWAPNYGVWEDEWQAICKVYEKEFHRVLGDDCIDRIWSKTDCYFGGSFDIPTEQRLRVDRPYYRIDKNQLQKALTPPTNHPNNNNDNNNDNNNNNNDNNSSFYRVMKANHISRATNINVYTPPNSIIHDDTGTTIQLTTDNDELLTVRTKLVVDCTGHETDLVLKDGRVKSIPPGFQIAYGCLVNVKDNDAVTSTQIGPYDKEAMTLFDYRTDHFVNEPSSWESKAHKDPTFMYAMPLEGNRIFFEETSLVARPAISFQECKDRCFRRLQHLGIQVNDIEEEEFCYIPMGGPLPAKDQRIIAFGGAAAMVHPSTGYNLCRNMMAATYAATAILQSNLNNINNNNPVNLDQVAADTYHAIWSPDNIRQRNFAVFGGEFLMKQNVQGLRGFFDGFFRLPLEYWSGFLAGWPGLPNNDKHQTWQARLIFGLLFVSKLPLQVAIDMILSIVTYSISEGIALPQSVTPLFGKPDSYQYYADRNNLNAGDVAAKTEAIQMILASKTEEVVPVAFESGTNIPTPIHTFQQQQQTETDDATEEETLELVVEEAEEEEAVETTFE